MSDQEQIKKIEEEINRLTEQVKEQYQILNQLKQQLQQLTHVKENLSSTSAKTGESASFIRQASRHASLENLIGLRLIHLIGIIVLVIGLSLGVKYAIDKNLISEGMRISLTYLAGLILYFFSARLKKHYPGFSAILFSGAMASLYFTTYAAYVYYALISFTVAFILMVLFTIYTVFEAIRYDRQEIALLGLVGAYGIPFLISPNKGAAELLFAYMTIINTGIVVLSAKKHWPLMGRVAQGITWVIFIGWLVMEEYKKSKGTAILFMCIFFLLFLLNAIAPKLVRKEKLDRNHTYQLLANNVAFYIAALYVFGYSFEKATIAIITLLLSSFAAVQALLFYWWKEEGMKKTLGYYALLLFVIFIGFQWKGITVTLLWLLTAVIIFIAGVKLKSIALRLASIGLMGVTLLKLVLLDSLTFTTIQKVIAYLVLGVLLLLISYFYQKFKEQLFGD